MTTYARADNGLVAELFTPPAGIPITDCFHSGLVWIPCDAFPGIIQGWLATETDGVWSFSARPAPPGPTPAQQAEAALNAGVQIVSTGTPSLNGTYECDADSQHRMMAVVLYTVINNTFPGGLSSYGWMDKGNNPHLFTGIDQFKEFATRIADYVSALEQVQFGVTSQLPGQPVTIA